MSRIKIGAAAIATAVSVAGQSRADIVWEASSGNLTAQSSFRIISTDLEVTLTNTSAADVQQTSDVLTGVFFNLSGGSDLSPVSAIIAPGSTVLFGTTDPGGVVGGEWGYKNKAAPGFSSGISTSHHNGFGPHTTFPGSNLVGSINTGGVEYGITSSGDNPATGTSTVTGADPLIRNSVVFRLGGLPSGFDLSQINAVQFQFGTSSSTPSLNATGPIPAPSTLITFIAGAALCRRRR
jgi:hypothetical protein